jgi:hypothetical protein
MDDFSCFKGPPYGWRAGPKAMVWHTLTVCALVSCLQIGRECLAQSAPEDPGVESPVAESPIFEQVPSEPSREEWRERVEAARQKAREIALERRNHPELYVVPEEDPERIATDRVLSDQSLQPGDIVSTKKGLFVFRGHPDQPRKTSFSYRLGSLVMRPANHPQRAGGRRLNLRENSPNFESRLSGHPAIADGSTE